MNEENKIKVYAPIIVDERVEKAAQEKASALVLPDERQRDLQYMRAIMVSAGTNKNGAHFLPSEMVKAHNTIVNKAIDLEHGEDKVIGHIYDCSFIYKNGEVFDPIKLLTEYEDASRSMDDLDIDIIVAGVIHKMRFPEIADEISAGEWKVSMECYFQNFDLLIGKNTIVTRDEAVALGYDPDELIGGMVKVMVGKKALGKQLVARVLRGITFSGIGMVKNPANPHSIVLETAAHKERLERREVVIDLENVDNLRGHRVELSSVETDVGGNSEGSDFAELKWSPARSIVVNSEGEFLDDPMYIEIDKETGGIRRIISVDTKEEAALRWTGPGIAGPGSVMSFPDNLCKSFKKRVTKFNALDQSENIVLHEHWCALFDESCPVIGASAKAPECLRNKRNRTIKDEQDNTLTKTIREHVDQAPGNTYVLSMPQLTLVDRSKQVQRLIKEAESLKSSLRAYKAGKGKSRVIEINSQPINSASVITPDKVVRYNDRMKAFETAKVLEPSVEREKIDGFVLQVGGPANPEIVKAGDDRDMALEKASSILKVKDTVVVLSKLQSKFGDVVVTKDQLLLSRKKK